MHKHSALSSSFYLNNPTFKSYNNELKSLVDLYNAATALDKPLVEQMIENTESELIRKLHKHFEIVDSDDDAAWRKNFIGDCREEGI